MKRPLTPEEITYMCAAIGRLRAGLNELPCCTDRWSLSEIEAGEALHAAMDGALESIGKILVSVT